MSGWLKSNIYAALISLFGMLLGEKILAAPVWQKQANQKKVVLPEGTWQSFDGRRYPGPATVSLAVPSDQLCFFEKVADTVTASRNDHADSKLP